MMKIFKTKRKITTSFRLDPDTLSTINMLSQKLKIKKSELIRQAIYEKLNRLKQNGQV